MSFSENLPSFRPSAIISTRNSLREGSKSSRGVGGGGAKLINKASNRRIKAGNMYPSPKSLGFTTLRTLCFFVKQLPLRNCFPWALVVLRALVVEQPVASRCGSCEKATGADSAPFLAVAEQKSRKNQFPGRKSLTWPEAESGLAN